MRRPRLRSWGSPRAEQAPGPRPAQETTVTLVCAMTSLAHQIADVEFTRAVTGRYRALCGTVVAASPMSVPEGRRCEHCADAELEAQARRGRSGRRGRTMRRPA